MSKCSKLMTLRLTIFSFFIAIRIHLGIAGVVIVVLRDIYEFIFAPSALLSHVIHSIRAEELSDYSHVDRFLSRLPTRPIGLWKYIFATN